MPSLSPTVRIASARVGPPAPCACASRRRVERLPRGGGRRPPPARFLSRAYVRAPDQIDPGPRPKTDNGFRDCAPVARSRGSRLETLVVKLSGQLEYDDRDTRIPSVLFS